jgi:hypothetical protein
VLWLRLCRTPSLLLDPQSLFSRAMRPGAVDNAYGFTCSKAPGMPLPYGFHGHRIPKNLVRPARAYTKICRTPLLIHSGLLVSFVWSAALPIQETNKKINSVRLRPSLQALTLFGVTTTLTFAQTDSFG